MNEDLRTAAVQTLSNICLGMVQLQGPFVKCVSSVRRAYEAKTSGPPATKRGIGEADIVAGAQIVGGARVVELLAAGATGLSY